MLNPNDKLPSNLKELSQKLSYTQAMPIGSEGSVPFIMLRLSTQNDMMIENNEITCEFKPSIFNIDFKEENIALCVVQFRLNDSDDYIYTTTYDLKNDTHYKDVSKLLEMKKYALLLVTESGHDFVEFEANFKGDFNPLTMLHGAREIGSAYEPGLFMEVAHALTSQGETPKALWDFLEKMAPADKKWYSALALGANKI